MTSFSFHGISKSYGTKKVLRGLSGEYAAGSITAIVGDNGRGKSTLAKVIAGVIRPDSGTLQLIVNNATISPNEIVQHCGFVAPYLSLYDEFTPLELMQLHARLQGIQHERERALGILTRIGLKDRHHSRVKTFSSGMRQRVAIALAIYHQPRLLVFDEPSLTLDRAGREVLEILIREFAAQGAIVFVATNDPREQQFCQHEIVIQ